MSCSICLDPLVRINEFFSAESEEQPPPSQNERTGWKNFLGLKTCFGRKKTNRMISSSSSNYDTVVATTCGHVFHWICVTSWFQMSSGVCPSCRNSEDPKKLLKLHIDIDVEPIDRDASISEADHLSMTYYTKYEACLKEKDQVITEKKRMEVSHKEEVQKIKSTYEIKLKVLKREVTTLKKTVQELKTASVSDAEVKD